MAAETKDTKENKPKTEEAKASFLDTVRGYIDDVRSELRKVTWPTREDIINLTRVVLIVTVLFALSMGALTAGMTLLIDQVGLNYPWIMGIIFVVITGVAIWWMRRGTSKARY